jgi:hypothetical protein
MNKTLFTRLGKLETGTPLASAIIICARWDETNEEALEAALPDGSKSGWSPLNAGGIRSGTGCVIRGTGFFRAWKPPSASVSTVGRRDQ